MFARTAEQRFGALGRMGIVAAIHVVGIFVIGRSLGIIPKIDSDPGPLVTDFIDDRTPPQDPPPIPDYQPPTQSKLYVPEPDVLPFDTGATSDVIGGEVMPPDGIDIGPGDNTPQPIVQGARLDARHPLSQPMYPPDLRRLGVEGAVDVEIYVQPDGRIGDARVVKSSGYAGFDRATLEEARRKWRMTPAMRDGVPFAQWYRLRVKFRLEDQR